MYSCLSCACLCKLFEIVDGLSSNRYKRREGPDLITLFQCDLRLRTAVAAGIISNPRSESPLFEIFIPACLRMITMTVGPCAPQRRRLSFMENFCVLKSVHILFLLTLTVSECAWISNRMRHQRKPRSEKDRMSSSDSAGPSTGPSATSSKWGKGCLAKTMCGNTRLQCRHCRHLLISGRGKPSESVGRGF